MAETETTEPRLAHPAYGGIVEAKKGIRLDIGCGANKQQGFLGMDLREVEGVDIVWDLEEFPWPLDDDVCTDVLASHILEHILPRKFFHAGGGQCVMGEVWRVLKPGGQLHISCPYGVSPGYVQDPTHCNPISEATLQYFDPRNHLYWVYQIPFMFTVEYVRYDFTAGFLEAVMAKRITPAGDQVEEAVELKVVKG